MAARVSIISPMYNVAAYVGECVESLKAQAFGDFEAIFVDDASPDASLAAAREAAGGDARFQFIALPDNGGQGAARNHALDVATGEYVLFLDADDAYVPETLSTLVSACEGEALDAAFFNARMQYDSHDLVRTNWEGYAERTGPAGVVDGYRMFAALSANGSFRSSACLYMLRHAVLEDAGLRFRAGIIHEDHLFTMQVFPHLERCAFLPDELYVRRMRHGSTMTGRRGIRNIDGLFKGAMELEELLYARAGEWPDHYIDAFAAELHETWDIIAHDARDAGQDELASYRAGLGPRERAAFDLHVVEAGRCLARTEESFTGSTTYRVGHALMAAPIWLKERLQKAPR